VGVLIVLIVSALVYFLVHAPLEEELNRLKATNSNLARENSDKEKKLKGYKELKEVVKAAEQRKEGIMRLNDARATPAHLMYELSNILTSKRMPTMTAQMIKEINNNPNRQFSQEWDAKHVWITKFEEKEGKFKLEGGAQSDGDMTQLALRLQASVFFHDVVPADGKEAVDKDSSITFYQFTIVGRVAY
jgi:Tfp pilus assembly protein PilN